MTIPPRAAPTLLAGTVLVALAACGDDGEGASTPPPTGSPAATTTASVASTSDSSPATSATPTTPASDGGAATRVVETPLGPVDVPTAPRRIVVLDGYAAMNLLAFGVRPAIVYGAYQSEVGGQAILDAGVELRPTQAWGLPNVEEIAAEHPDLIVATNEGSFIDTFEHIAAIAPTVVLPYEVPWRDAILGDTYGMV